MSDGPPAHLTALPPPEPATARVRPRTALVPPAAPPAPAGHLRPTCAHQGPATGGLVDCPSCQGTVRLRLFSCALHGVCTAQKRAGSVACCAACPDYFPRGEG